VFEHDGAEGEEADGARSAEGESGGGGGGQVAGLRVDGRVGGCEGEVSRIDAQQLQVRRVADECECVCEDLRQRR